MMKLNSLTEELQYSFRPSTPSLILDPSEPSQLPLFSLPPLPYLGFGFNAITYVALVALSQESIDKGLVDALCFHDGQSPHYPVRSRLTRLLRDSERIRDGPRPGPLVDPTKSYGHSLLGTFVILEGPPDEGSDGQGESLRAVRGTG